MQCLILVPVLLPAATFAAAPMFGDVLMQVERREPRTGAILTVKATEAEREAGAAARFSNFEIRIEDETATVEMYNNYLTGKEGVTYSFPIEPKIEAEHRRLVHLDRLQKLDAAVADAERRRRIFLLSSFKLEEGSDEKELAAVFGEPRRTEHWMRAGWKSLEYREVSVVIGFGKVHDIQPRRDEPKK